MQSRFCPVRQYSKDKPDKFRVDFFILANAEHYFIYHLDCYQGKNRANIDIDPTIKRLPTTQKDVANAILISDIANDPNGCKLLYMDNCYAAPQLFAIMVTTWNIRVVGICKSNRKGFHLDTLKMDNVSDRGDFLRLVDDRVGMVITPWKGSKVLQAISTVMEHGTTIITRCVGQGVIDVVCPNDIVLYQRYMGGVDRGDQYCVKGAGFFNISHYKK
eukprot:6980906-Ditylum_brightwellii.AAC.1